MTSGSARDRVFLARWALLACLGSAALALVALDRALRGDGLTFGWFAALFWCGVSVLNLRRWRRLRARS